MLITDIRQQSENKDRRSVFIDGKFAFGLSAVDVLFYKLHIGDEISDERYEYILNEAVYSSAKNKAAKLISFRQRSESELRGRLARDFGDEIIDRVIGMLKKYGYIDDEKFAAAFVRECIDIKKWGAKKIRYELKLKGISDDTAQAAIDGALRGNTKQTDAAAALLEKRLRGKSEITYKERQKHTAYLAGRGFDFDDINAAYNALEISFTGDYSH